MLKKNKWKLILSSIVILLPVLLGVFGQSLLPDEIIVHWGLDGNPDGWANPLFIFTLLPIILFAIHWLCMILSHVLDKNEHQNPKVMEITFWIIPALSLGVCGMLLATAMGHTANTFAIMLLLIGVTFIIIGNYMPKTTRNRTMGIKIKWTLANDENWHATHRFAGKVYVILGFLCLVSLPLPSSVFPFLAIGIILVSILLPTLYSYSFYKNQLSRGEATKEDYEKELVGFIKNKKLAAVVSVALTVILAVVLFIVMFTGNVSVTLEEESLRVEATYWSDLSLNYESIAQIEYREDGVDGARVGGYGSARLLLGQVQNEEFGGYTRYTYTGDRPCIVVTTAKGGTLVIGLEDAEGTRTLYDELTEKLGK